MRRFLKSTALEISKRRNHLSSLTFSRSVLNFMKIDLHPPRNPVIFPNGAKAACVVSIDFDHLTKSSESSQSKWIPKRSDDLLIKNKIGTRDLLDVSERHKIPMTWAICGQTAEEDPTAYRSILESQQPQEIGVHTYSHIDVSASTEDELEVDIQKCLKVLDLKVPPKTFIFPWNRQGHFEKLKKMGFTVYREQDRAICLPFKNQSLWNIPPTYYIDKKSFGAHELIMKYLDLCISWNSTFHLWFHPWSVVTDNDGEFVRNTLDPLFRYINEKQASLELEVLTMGDLSDFLSAQAIHL
jgi:peptidoglycan/xylan/chitin deacetylase (PgdA/CDA1 family)